MFVSYTLALTPAANSAIGVVVSAIIGTKVAQDIEQDPSNLCNWANLAIVALSFGLSARMLFRATQPSPSTSDTVVTLDTWQEGDPLPNSKNAVIDSEGKFVKYSMNPDNVNNDGKWKAFRDLGYDTTTEDGRRAGAADIVRQIHQQLDQTSATRGQTSPYGTKMEVRLLIVGPNGRSATLFTGWIYDTGSSVPRMFTNWAETH